MLVAYPDFKTGSYPSVTDPGDVELACAPGTVTVPKMEQVPLGTGAASIEPVALVKNTRFFPLFTEMAPEFVFDALTVGVLTLEDALTAPGVMV